MDVVSVIIPVFNAGEYLIPCLDSVAASKFDRTQIVVELSIFDDGSHDGSYERLLEWRNNHSSMRILIGRNENRSVLSGAGAARNRAIGQSTGRYLCFLDSDDVMMPNRIQVQYEVCRNTMHGCSGQPHALPVPCIIGSNFRRIPEGSATRYSSWLNNLTQKELWTQRFKEITMIQPTWFMHRSTYDLIGPYSHDLAEDMDYFYRAFDSQCILTKVEKPLLAYRWHAQSGLSNKTDWRILTRIKAKNISKFVCCNWSSGFMIWGCNRDGKRLFRELSPEAQQLVTHFTEVNPNKVGKIYSGKPIVHRDQIQTPFLCCVAKQRANGIEEQLVRFVEGVDFFQCV